MWRSEEIVKETIKSKKWWKKYKRNGKGWNGDKKKCEGNTTQPKKKKKEKDS